ncbi:MAG: septal ring lytic transglycosylase RlpA family protein [Pseudomonadota bacterium]
MTRSVTHSLLIALTTASGVIAFVGPAQADRQAAPIVYATPDSHPNLATQAPRSALPSTQAPVSITSENRVDFRHPGQITAGETEMAAPTAAAPVLTLDGTALPVASAPTQPIRIASVEPQAPVRTGKPLTLSRVNANADAAIGDERGLVSIYPDGFDGQPTANGELFDEKAMMAAHPSLPLPSLVQVTNEANGREVVVRVNDRGPFGGKQILELSPRAGNVLGIARGSDTMVRLRYLGSAPVQRNNQNYAPVTVEAESLPPVTRMPTPEAMPEQRITVATYAPPKVSTPTPRPTVAATPSAQTGNVFIQAGSFADIANAQRLTVSLGRGYSVKIEEAHINGGDYFRVLIGPYQSASEADLYRQELSRAGIVDGFITTR